MESAVIRFGVRAKDSFFWFVMLWYKVANDVNTCTPALLVTRSMQHGAADVIVNSLPFPNLNTFFNTHMILPHLDLPVPRIV